MITAKFDGSPYAAKELEKRRFMKHGVLDQKVDQEMKIMQKIHHPNIVQFIEHIDWEDYLYIIMEYVPSGDLGSLVGRGGAIQEAEVKIMAAQLVDALKYLHGKNITHRDVKPDNILIKSTSPFQVKLTDFGLSKMVDSEETFLRTFCGTLLYCAPEVYSEYREYDNTGKRAYRGFDKRLLPPQRYDHAVDIWSLAGVLFYTLCASPPYPAQNGTSYLDLLNQIMTKALDIRPLQLHNVSDQCIRFIKSMLNVRPEYRATVIDLEKSSWFTGIDSQQDSYDEDDEVDMIRAGYDSELEEGASQLSIKERGGLEVGDSQQNVSDLTDIQQPENPSSFDTSQSNGNESYGFMANANLGNGKLFGEIDVSALGSSGAIPYEHLPVPRTVRTLGNTFSILRGTDAEAESERLNLAGSWAVMPPPPLLSDTEKNSELEECDYREARSSSLMGAESLVGQLNMESPSATSSSYGGVPIETATETGNTATNEPREDQDGLIKPLMNTGGQEKNLINVSHDDSSDANLSRERIIKPDFPPVPPNFFQQSNISLRRRRSEDHVASDDDLSPLGPKRQKSTRGIKISVVPSTVFWSKDKSTHHYNYPKIDTEQYSQYQYDAVRKGQTFAAGQEFFESTMLSFKTSHGHTLTETTRAQSEPMETDGRRTMMEPDDDESISSVEAIGHTPRDNTLPDTARGSKEPHANRPVRGTNIPSIILRPAVGNDFQRPKPILAKLRGDEKSCLPTVNLNITETFTSWGRGYQNTIRYSDGHDVRVPKYAFKIFLFKPGFYDPESDDVPQVTVDKDMHFYISTKASSGITINGIRLPSHHPNKDNKDPCTPSKYWGKLYNGDIIKVWQHNQHTSEFTKFNFECLWGASSEPRIDAIRFEVMPQVNVLAELEDACLKLEKLALVEAEERTKEEKKTRKVVNIDTPTAAKA
jgi:serine/threonine protein kinase